MMAVVRYSIVQRSPLNPIHQRQWSLSIRKAYHGVVLHCLPGWLAGVVVKETINIIDLVAVRIAIMGHNFYVFGALLNFNLTVQSACMINIDIKNV